MSRSTTSTPRRTARIRLLALLLLALLVGAGWVAHRIRTRAAAVPDLPPGELRGSLLDAYDRHGVTPLMMAARRGDTEAIAGLVAAGADLERLDLRNGWTPLVHALHKGSAAAVAALLGAGADPNHRPRSAEPPLFFALQTGDTGMVRLLLDAGADPYATDADGTNALLLAVEGGFLSDVDRAGRLFGGCDDETVRLLFERAPDLRLPPGMEAKFAGFLARWHGCRETLALLAEHRVH
ncbi:MAG: ankyrin repeat domain-containing protein [Thermoanaerobaculia bacterium]